MQDSLRNLPPFSKLDDAALEALLESGEILYYAKGDIIPVPELPDDGFCFLIEGRWEQRRKVGNTPMKLSADKPGAWCHGVRILDALAAEEVEATSDVILLTLPVDVVHAMAAGNPELAVALIDGLSAQVAALATQMGRPQAQPAAPKSSAPAKPKPKRAAPAKASPAKPDPGGSTDD